MYSIAICEPLGDDVDRSDLIIWDDQGGNILDLGKDTTSVINAELNLELNTAGSLSLTLPYNNIGYDKIIKMKTVIKVFRENYDLHTMEEIWRGRAISDDFDLWNNRVLFCEGELALLNDTVQPQARYKDKTIAEFLQALLDEHNSNYEDENYKFHVGEVTVEKRDDLLYWSTDYESTWECIKKYLLDEYGGVLRVRWGYEDRYLDYLRDYPEPLPYITYQEIEFGTNLVDIKKSYDSSDFATAILPLGSYTERPDIENKVLYDPGNGDNTGYVYIDPETQYIGRRSEIEDVFPDNPTLVIGDKNYRKILQFSSYNENDGIVIRYIRNSEDSSTPQMVDLKTMEDSYPDFGKYVKIGEAQIPGYENTDWIEDENAIFTYGRIEKVVQFDDIDDPVLLFRHGKQFLDDILNAGATIELSAVDMHNYNVDIRSIDFLDKVRVISTPHQIDDYFTVVSMTIPLNNPTAASIELSNNIYNPVVEFSDILGETLIGEGVSRPVKTLVAGVKRALVSDPPSVAGIFIDSTIPDSYDRVSYIDAEGNILTGSDAPTPAHMDFTTGTFDYGSWENAFFMPKPCILGTDGTVICYLDPNDYTKDVDGNTVTIDSNLSNANVMMEWPKIWRKIVPEMAPELYGSVTTSARIYFSDTQLDADYKDWAYIDQNGVHKDHFYTAVYNASLPNTNQASRSISNANVLHTKTYSENLTYAQRNGNGWYFETLADVDLINLLLVYMGKSTDTQAVFGMGKGMPPGGISAVGTVIRAYRTGKGNQRGLFWGTGYTTSTESWVNIVKVFGMENWWGLQRRWFAGLATANNTSTNYWRWWFKMCFGTEDGSMESNYNTSGTGYLNGGWVTKRFINDGMIANMQFDMTILPYSSDYNEFGKGFSDTAYGGGTSSNKCAAHGGCTEDTNTMGAFNLAMRATNYSNVTYGHALTYR